MNQKAMSPVVTTLVILLISVLLASVVTYFAINARGNAESEQKQDLITAMGDHSTQRLWCFDTLETAQDAQFMLDDAYYTANCTNYYFGGPYFHTSSVIIDDPSDLRGEFGLYYNVTETGVR